MRFRLLLLLLAAFAALPTPGASARPPDPADPPCPSGAVPPVTLSASDGEDGDRDLTATHTIGLHAEEADEGIEIDDLALVLPPGAQTVPGEADSFRSDAPGPVTVTAQWQHLVMVDGTAVPRASYCTASATTTFNLEPPKPLRLSLPRRRGMMTELFWRVRVGEDADLRPVEVRLRGVRRKRLPPPSAAAQTFTIGLRAGDKPMFAGTGRVLRAAGWRFRFGPYFRREFPIRMSKFEKSRRLGFGFELDFLQGGVRIARTRALGSCVFAYGPLCTYRSVAGAAGAQAPAPPCPPGVAPAATIRGHDVEDEGGPLTATHTILIEAHGRDGQIPRTENADRRPLELRFRSARRVIQMALRRGDPGTSPGRPFRFEAGGWMFAGAVVDDRRTGTGVFIKASRIGLNRDRAEFRGTFRQSIDIMQAGRRIGRVRVAGHCATFCTWRSR